MGKRIKRERSEIREKGILRDLSRGNSPTNALIGKSVKQPVTKLTKPSELTKLATKLPKLLIAQIEHRSTTEIFAEHRGVLVTRFR